MAISYKISADKSFIDSFAQGYLERNLHQYGQDILIIFPNKLAIGFFIDALTKIASSNFILPVTTSLLEEQDPLDPFCNFSDFFALPNKIHDSDFKYLVWEQYDKWYFKNKFIQNMKMQKLHFCSDFIKFYQDLLEANITKEEFTEIKDRSSLTYYEKVLINFYHFFSSAFDKIKSTQNLTTITERNNALIEFKAHNLNKLKQFKFIIFAGTTAINNATKIFLEKILQQKNSIFIYHESLAYNLTINNQANYAINNIIKKYKLENATYFDKIIAEKTKEWQFIECKNLEEEADVIVNLVRKSKEKTSIITYNHELQKLILCKLGKFSKQEISYDNRISDLNNLYKFFIFYLQNNDPKRISLFLEKSLGIESANFPVNKISMQQIFNYLLELKPNIFSNYHNINNYLQLIDEEKDIDKKLEILKFFHNKNSNIYYNDSDILIATAQELRLKNFNKLIIADINQNSWEVRIHEILNNIEIKQYHYSLKELREGQIANDFLRQLSSSKIIFTRNNSNNGQKADIYYLFKQIITSYKIDKIYANNLANIAYYIPKKQYEITLDKKYKSHDLSVTQIEKLLSNPYSIYALKILKLSAIKHFPREEEQQIFGIICHKTLEIAILKKMNLAEMLLYFENKLKNYKIRNSLITAWRNRFANIAMAFTAIPHSPEILTEYTLEHNLNNLPIKIKAQIDRLEFFASHNKIKIIDYKTGNKPSLQSIKRGYSLQLILTFLLVERFFPQYNINIEYWILKGKNYEAINFEQIDDEFTKSMVQYAKENLAKIISDYQNSNIAIKAFPDLNNINIYDDYFHLARQDKI
jgi:hypothetical protein